MELIKRLVADTFPYLADTFDCVNIFEIFSSAAAGEWRGELAVRRQKEHNKTCQKYDPFFQLGE